jgi:hypothetical protein
VIIYLSIIGQDQFGKSKLLYKMKMLIRKIACIVTIVSLVFVPFLTHFVVGQAYAGLVTSASIQLGDSRPSQSGVTYTALFTPTASSIGCINIVFATNPDMTGGKPAVLTTTSAVKVSISGTGLTPANWTLTNTTDGTLTYKTATPDTPSSAVTVVTSTITNTSVATFYAQVDTFTTNSCATPVDSSNVIALTTLAGVTASVTVSPTIAFAVTNYGSAVNGSGDTSPVTTTSTTIPFGTVAAGATAWGSQTLTVSTNGAHGYTLYVRDSQALTNANSDTVRNQAGTPAAPNDFDANTSQSSFAYTADGAGVTFGSNKWAGVTQANVAIATRTTAYNSDATHVEYKVGISNTQPPGAYSTVIAYTATPSY